VQEFPHRPPSMVQASDNTQPFPPYPNTQIHLGSSEPAFLAAFRVDLVELFCAALTFVFWAVAEDTADVIIVVIAIAAEKTIDKRTLIYSMSDS
jgi:hypothetical protein